MKNKKTWIVLCCIFILWPWSGYAQNSPWRNRFIFDGLSLLGVTQVAGSVDNLYPLLGDQHHILFIDGTFSAASQEAYLSSLGLGGRILRSAFHDDDMILGAYSFADYQYTPNNTQVWYVNPGLELFTHYQEIRVQGYFPVTSTQQPYAYTTMNRVPQEIKSAATAANGHTVFDTPVTLLDSFGTGVEVEVSQYIPHASVLSTLGNWVSGGYYYYHFPNSSPIAGVEANIRFSVNQQTALIIQDNYDNQKHNQVFIGMRIKFGGPNESVSDLGSRMEAQISRHIARKPYALVGPVYNKVVPTGNQFPVFSNGWFFSPTGTNQGPQISSENCTAEHPCLNLTQDIANGIQAIDPGAHLLFSSGQYSLAPNATLPGNPNAVLLNNGQSLWGLSSNWQTLATGANRPTIQGALFWGNNHGGLNPTLASGFIHNMQVVNSNTRMPAAISGYTETAAIAVGATDSLTITDSIISSTGSSLGTQAIAGWTLNGDMVVSNTTLKANTIGVGSHGTTNYFAYGLLSQNGNITLSNSNTIVSTQGNYADAYGLFSATQNIQASNFSAAVSTAGTQANGFGSFSANGNNVITSTHGQGVQVSTTGQNANAYGVYSATQQAQVSNAHITATTVGNNANAFGVWANNLTGQLITLSHATVESRTTGIGAMSVGLESNHIDFTGLGSLVSVSSIQSSATPVMGIVTNQSSPLSQCQVNGGNEVVC